MSLRFWSDEIALAPVLRQLGSSDVVHVRGMPVPPGKSAKPRIAPRHYSSIAREKGRYTSDVDVWMHKSLAAIRNDLELTALIETHQIEGTFWIAILGDRPLPMPTIDRRLVEDAASLGLTIFIENYTVLEDGNPSRHWFPHGPATTAPAQSLRA